MPDNLQRTFLYFILAHKNRSILSSNPYYQPPGYSSSSRGELGGESGSQTVRANWVGYVLSPALNGALASYDGLNEIAKHGEHSKSTVFNLFDLQLGKGIGVVGKA